MRSRVVWEGVERQGLRQRSQRMERAQPGQRPDLSQPAGADRLPQIKHIVVLMMENHSFDNYLGTLTGRGDGFPIGADGQPKAQNPRRLQLACLRLPSGLDRPAARSAVPELEGCPRSVGRRQDERLRDGQPDGRAGR